MVNVSPVHFVSRFIFYLLHILYLLYTYVWHVVLRHYFLFKNDCLKKKNISVVELFAWVDESVKLQCSINYFVLPIYACLGNKPKIPDIYRCF